MSNNRRLKKKRFLYFSDVWQGAIADPSIVFERKESTPSPPPLPPFAEDILFLGGWQVYKTHLYWAPLPSSL
jgi:hypothetical protein